VNLLPVLIGDRALGKPDRYCLDEEEKRMKSRTWIWMSLVSLFAALTTIAQAEVVYTAVNVVIPANGSYNIDLNQDGTTDFTLLSHLLQVYCQSGEGIVWYVAVQNPGNEGVVAVGQNPVALKRGAPIDSGQIYYGGSALLIEFAYGDCGNFLLGNWLSLPDRYLGFEFQIQGNHGPETHYGWAQVSVAGYIDQHGDLQAKTFLSDFAFESVPGKAIAAGQEQ
jgi:hypothetical protein